MGPHDLKQKGAFFALKSVNFNDLMSAAPKLALVSVSRYYCDVNWSYHNIYVPSFNRIKKELDEAP